MNIALIAHDKKKDLMIDFCIAYTAILKKHNICATETTGTMVADATGLPIKCFLPGADGGDQQICARIAYNEIDAVLFFRDPLTKQEYEPNIDSLYRLCDVHSVPLATNIATAELLIMGIEHGDLDWREYTRAKRVI